jgi:hypothetical protein
MKKLLPIVGIVLLVVILAGFSLVRRAALPTLALARRTRRACCCSPFSSCSWASSRAP